MAKQVYWEDVQVGTEVAPLKKSPTPRQLVQWAGASGDYYEIHYNSDFAKSTGLSNIIVHGLLKVSFLGQMMTDWVGEQGALKKIGCQHRGMDFPGDPVVCKGKVTKKYEQDDEHLVECEIWTENPKGEKTAPGTAIASLPSKAK